jgi:membrane protein DedA with SNARE-associated domain
MDSRVKGSGLDFGIGRLHMCQKVDKFLLSIRPHDQEYVNDVRTWYQKWGVSVLFLTENILGFYVVAKYYYVKLEEKGAKTRMRE